MQDPNNKEERLQWVADHLGYGRSCLEEYKATFGLRNCSFYKDRREVLEKMEDRLGDQATSWAKDLVERYEYLYERALSKGHLQTAATILEKISKLKGLDVQKIEVKSEQAVELDWGVGGEEVEIQ